MLNYMPQPPAVTAYSVPKRRLSEEELATWRAFVRAHNRVARALERDLEEAGGLTLSELDVLITLAAAPHRAVRLSQLADRVLLTKSGITRLVDRLEAMGLVERRPCESDGRGLNAVLTEAGREAHRRAMGRHLRRVAVEFTDRIRPSEAPMLRDALERIADERA